MLLALKIMELGQAFFFFFFVARTTSSMQYSNLWWDKESICFVLEEPGNT